jgi:hypothetical protein
MGRPRKPKIKEKDLQGFKHFKLLLPVLEKLHDHACEADRAGNRKLHFDQYSALMLLYFFNPIVTSLRGMQQASALKKVQHKLGCERASLGSLSDASRVFDAELLRGVIGELVDQLPPLQRTAQFEELRGTLTIVDSTLLPALPKIIEAMWRGSKNQLFKLHTHFELLRGVPTRMDVGVQHDSDRSMLRAALQADRIYVLDAGFYSCALFQDILDKGSSLVCRMNSNTLFDVIEERSLNEAAREVNVLRDCVVRLSGHAQRIGFDRSIRVVEVRCKPHQKRGGRKGQGGPCQGSSLLIATDMLDVPADIIAALYRHRWAIETFFRFFKHVLGCRHLLSHTTNGIEIQTYVAIIACLLIALWTGCKPTLRTYEMICFYFSGLADEEELLAHIQKLQPQN